MKEDHTTEELECARENFERQTQQNPYVSRPKWQLVFAWVLFGIVLLGIINICWLQFSAG